MNSIHDMGGMHGFGPVEVEAGEPAFHQPWEGRVLALSRAILYSRAWSIDSFRHAQERLPARVYLSVSYYHRWLLALTRGAVEEGLLDQEELAAGHARAPGRAVPRKLTAGEVARVFIRAPFGRTPRRDPVFRVGDAVRTRNGHPTGHTRLPRYARDKVGRIEAIRGCHAYPDAEAAGVGDDPQWLYTVAFDGQTLWGPQSDASLSVTIDAFEPYLQVT